MKNQKLLHIFWDTPMSMQHKGLSDWAEKHASFDLKDMEEGDLCAFINKKQDKIKIVAGLNESNGHGVIGYYKSPKGHPIDITALQYIPMAFQGGKINMDRATKKAVEEHLFRANEKKKFTAGKYKGEQNANLGV